MSIRTLRPTLWVLARLAAASMFIALIAVPAAADVFVVTLNNGNTFISKYKPREATYDTSKLLIMTDVGNIIALSKSDVAEVTNDTESRGFGVVIDTSTIMIGYTANDAPIPGEEGEGDGQQFPGGFPAQGFQGGAFPGFSQPAAPYSAPLIGEPNAGGGIPVSFATSGYVPTGPPAGYSPP